MDPLVCPICGHKASAQDFLSLHVLREHLSFIDSRLCYCFCGLSAFNRERGLNSKFLDHCRKHGGVVKHYLECLMGE